MESTQQQPHSSAYFGDYRDFWWNLDFLKLMGHRLNFAEVRTMLDVGSGLGHWGQILATVLPQEAKITGIDREAEWVTKAADRSKDQGDRFKYQHGDACAIPFPDNSFDMVTCQTVLIHLQDPTQCLKEMLRVKAWRIIVGCRAQ